MASEVGQLEIALSFNNSSLKNSIKSTDSTINNSANNFSAKYQAAAALVTSVVQKAFNKITSIVSNSMSTAIKRVDTLNNSQKVFTAMGYEADAVSQSMSTLNDYLAGLPTSLTDAVQGVQSLSASFGGIEAGTEYFVAMNNAGLAFGATSDQVANAITQLGQLSLDGSLDAETWNSLRNSGFGPVFAAMAKEAGTTVGALKADFGGRGTKTVQDFLDSLVRLNKEGSGSMEALESLARKNTDGIGTAMENVQNRAAKAIAKIIDDIGSENIANAINTLSSHFSDVADIIVGAIHFIGDNIDWIIPLISTIGAAFATMFVVDKVNKAVTKVKGFISSVTSVLDKFRGKTKDVSVDFKTDSSNIAKSSDNMAKSGESLSTRLSNAIQGISKVVSTVFQSLGQVLGSVVGAVMEPIKVLLRGIGDAIAGFFEALANPALLVGVAVFTAAAAGIAAAILLIGSSDLVELYRLKYSAAAPEII